MSINKTINQTKIYNGENTVDVIGEETDELKVHDWKLFNILSIISMQLEKIEKQLSLLTNEEIGD